MARLSPIMLFSLVALLAAGSAHPVGAQQWNEFSRPHYDLFVDGDGRRFLVDPQTDEVVGRANRHARFTRRDKIRAQRAFQRSNRRIGIASQLDDLLDEERRSVRHTDAFRASRHRRDRLLDGFGDDELTVGSTRRYDNTSPRRSPRPPSSLIAPLPQLKETLQHQQVARLPEQPQPIKRSSAVDGIRKPQLDVDQMAKLQIALDREGFSPGVIDGLWGSNLARALLSRKAANKEGPDLTNTAELDAYFDNVAESAFTTYRLTEADIAGPYVISVPVDYAQKAALNALSYTSVAEMLAERFHMSEAFLRQLNPGQRFDRRGALIKVVAPGAAVTKKVHYIVADKANRQLRAFDRNGGLVASYPATIGSASTPSPTGTHSVKRIALNPEYTYDPKKNFQQGENDKVLRIPPGPNGPVGSVWIALSKPSYGIHGTPNPATIGKTSSHGCIRLTNWDALELASLVRDGVTVEFVE